jgi:hypothetical protein
MAVQFNASTDQLAITSGLPNLDNFSACGWARAVNTPTTYETIFSSTNASDSHILQTNSGTSLAVYGGSYSAAIITVNTNWFFWAYTKNGTNLVGYAAYPGNALASQSISYGSGASQNIEVGNNSNYSENWDGNIAAVKIWDGVVLTAAQFERERYTYLPRRWANLYGFYPLIGTGGTTFHNWAGGNDFVEGGTVDDVQDGPPISWGAPTLFIPQIEAAVSGLSIPVAMHEYRQRHQSVI